MDAHAGERRITPLPVPPGTRSVLLFGGTFDPPHRAHVDLAAAACRRVLGPDAWLVFVPAARSPFKTGGSATPAHHRARMLLLATHGLDRAAVWTDEIDRTPQGEASFWVATLERARASLPDDADLRFLIGSDQAEQLHRWRDPGRIIKLARPVVLLRPPARDAADMEQRMAPAIAECPDLGAVDWRKAVCPLELSDASATAIRAALRTRQPDATLDRLLHPDVLAYIRRHALYQSRPG